MATVKLYNEQGQAVKDLKLNPTIFDVEMNNAVLRQVVVAMQANQRQNLAHTKTRGEVAGGGRKPWRQKGTGRARHGSIRSPLWIGGGVTFGPRNDRNYSKKINKKMRRKALFIALSDRVRDEQFKAIEALATSDFKTKTIVDLLNNLGTVKSVLLVTDKQTKELVKSVSNIPKVDVIEARNLNVLDVIKYQNIVASTEALKQLETVFLTAQAGTKETAEAK